VPERVSTKSFVILSFDDSKLEVESLAGAAQGTFNPAGFNDEFRLFLLEYRKLGSSVP